MRVSLRTDGRYAEVSRRIAGLRLHTVCSSARCPNRHECWNSGTATVMLLGDTCTRNCRFCAVAHGVPLPPDPGEPARVARAARELGLRHVVLTSVTRDDLPDGGASVFAAAIRALRSELPDATVEVLTPDFRGSEDALGVVVEAGPDVFNHNLETVRRLQVEVRPQASYERSLGVLRSASARGRRMRVKSGLMLGMGETEDEVLGAMADLRSVLSSPRLADFFVRIVQPFVEKPRHQRRRLAQLGQASHRLKPDVRVTAAQRQLQGLQRRFGINLFQRLQSGFADADMVVVQRLGQRGPTAAALTDSQLLRGFDALPRSRILTEHVFQRVPRLVLSQLRQSVQSGRR